MIKDLDNYFQYLHCKMLEQGRVFDRKWFDEEITDIMRIRKKQRKWSIEFDPCYHVLVPKDLSIVLEYDLKVESLPSIFKDINMPKIQN